jgi:hypothetical protein
VMSTAHTPVCGTAWFGMLHLHPGTHLEGASWQGQQHSFCPDMQEDCVIAYDSLQPMQMNMPQLRVVQ